MPEAKARPARANSFHRMLELEKQYMLERLQTSKPPLDPQSPASHVSPVRSSIQARRAEVRPPPTSEPRRGPRPLVINTAAPKKTVPAPREPVVDDAPAAVASPVDKPGPKVVAFAFPPKEMAKDTSKDMDRRSICVSPSWESQSRRREEKKMMEKKKREEKDREKEEAKTARTRRGRLSKLPPLGHREPKPPAPSQTAPREPLSVPSSKSTPTLPSLIPVSKPQEPDRGRKEHRNSFFGKDEQQQPRKTRSRSSSFASLFRSPFERRRSSVDHSSEPEFIGGIKLELERHLDGERAAMAQAGADEGEIHPALRDNKPALKSPPPEGKDPNRRHYPPITRHGKAQNARALVSPTAPAVPDVPKADKWRVRMGLKPKAEEQPAPAASQESKDAKPAAPVVSQATANPAAVTAPAAGRTEEQDISNNESIPSVESHGYRTAPSSPSPPHRSPKRSQQSFSDGEGKPPKTPVAEVKAETLSTLSVTPKASELSRPAPPGTPMQGTEPSSDPAADQQAAKRPSSSEDSCSEEYHSPSPPSTPATSRPQSERGVSADRSKALTQRTSAAVDEDIYEIQAAADRVLADFDKPSPERLSFEKQRSSFETMPEPRSQPGRLKDRASLPSVNRMSVPARKAIAAREHSQSPRPAAASYLQEARKLVPIAPPTRAGKQRLGPPASFILPGDLPSPSVRSEASRSCETMLTTTTRSLARHSTASLLPGMDREPVAKFFVECCGCKYYHDMPSNLYEAMADPGAMLAQRDTMGYVGSISVQVKCPWCRHEMSTKCCAGLAAMVYVTERLH
ncbi:hypothetical protein JDV02_008934 [Purpureocillium takamizusanense]|uniref:Uncharacterized protein n=1 Tax=Purpureocillium takamizusanense TaxID=2060973 RepID=A0A9Q8QNQ8_9HYPO|nr:uncharacterized protein JDV02_008934 [Purpureocillium takamizusanense]UNI23095.1 hypothetical protein JDV02_008934 [Purpureocillium takamizusanense]